MNVQHRTLKLLDDLAADEHAQLTSADVRARLGLSSQAVSNLLSRLVDAGLLDRVARGVYALRPLGRLGTRAASEDVTLAVGAVFGGEPHRIAYRSALDHHDLLVHPARNIQVALPRRVKLAQISGRRLQPVYERADTVMYGTQGAGHGAMVSSVERAMLENAARLDLCGGWGTLAGALLRADVDPERLVAFVGQLDAGIAVRRIASIAEVLGLTKLSDALPLPPRRARLVELDPQEPPEEPWTDTRWRVRWPMSPRQARALIDA
jgi:predicted transcriptional regulator of viral defense system